MPLSGNRRSGFSVAKKESRQIGARRASDCAPRFRVPFDRYESILRFYDSSVDRCADRRRDDTDTRACFS